MSNKTSTPILPKVSICCITYNHEKYIRDCMEGFLMQKTNFPIEIVIHDDASTDRTPQIVKAYADHDPDSIRAIFQTENQFSKGKKPLINLTLPHAKGKYIALCEGDDYWTDPYKLRKQVDFLEANPDYVTCYHDAMIIDEDGKIKQASKLPDNFKHDFSREELLKGAWILTLTNCFRNVMKDIPEEMAHVYNGDTFFNSLLGNYGKGKYMADVKPAVYRTHSASIWSSLKEFDKMFHGGVSRTWMYRYYKRTGQHDVANCYRDLAIDYFIKGIKATETTNQEQYGFIAKKIKEEYYDIFEGKNGNILNRMLMNSKCLFDKKQQIKTPKKPAEKKIVCCGGKDFFSLDLLMVDWIVTRRCNYQCSYCTVHDNINGFFIPLRKMQTAVDRIAELPNSVIRVNLAGGEPIIYPEYIEFIDYLSDKLGTRGHITTQTNLGLSLTFLKNLVKRLEGKKERYTFNASFHHDHAEANAFIEKVRYLADNGMDLVVKLCVHPLHMDEIMTINKQLVDLNNPRIRTDLVIIRENFGVIPDKRYSQKDLDWFKEVYRGSESKNALIDFLEEDGNCLIRETFTPNEIIANGLNQFKGMVCNAGKNMISINADGALDPAVCFRKKRRVSPNIYDSPDALSLIPKTVVCPFEKCGVPSDLLNIKYLPDYVSDPSLQEKHPDYKSLIRPDAPPHDISIDLISGNEEPQNKEDDMFKTNQKIKRILFVNHSLFPLEISGTPLSTRNHALGMVRKGLEVAVLIPREEIKAGYGKERSADGFTLYQVPAMDKRAAYFAGLGEDGLSEYGQVIEEVIEDFHPQVVQINDFVFMPAEIMEIFARRGCIVVREVCNCEELCHRDYPVISTGLDGRLCSGPESSRKCADCFSDPPESAHEKTEIRFDSIKKLYKDAVDEVIFTSGPFKEYFTRFVPIPDGKTKVIPRGFDFDFPRDAHPRREFDGTVHFAFVANIMFSKGVDVALHAFEKICHETNFVLHVYGQMGNPEYADWLNRLEAGYPGRFIYHGKFEEKDLPGIASRIDVCIIPSYFDTYNRVLREFLYLGIPVIATDFFGAYIVHEGGNGFRIPVGDADALAGRMTELINHPDRIEELARGAAQTRIPTLEDEIDALIGSYNDLYDRSSETRKALLDKMTTPDKTFRSIAFYLPQFHPIPENDRWWGKGFTEWTNVAKARPLFPGHHQPHLPADLGFYDLRLPDTRKRQAELAGKYGVDGFCYWHYWFTGKRLLDRPFGSVLESGEPDFPFCLAWANETWSKRWLGEERNILMKQEYSEEDDRNHALWLVTAFEDKRYIKVNHRPLFLIYRPKDLPDPGKTAEIIRQTCLQKGLADPYLVGINSHCKDTDCRGMGFDETLYFMPQLSCLPECMNDDPSESKLRRNAALGVNSSKLKIYDYEEAMDSMLSGLKKLEHPVIPSLFVGWDNVARRGENGVIVHNASPEKFGRALQAVVDSVQGRPAQQRFVFLNAWNEWAEGNHLEPDHRNGHAFLEEVRKVKSNGNIRKTDPPQDVQVVRKELPPDTRSVSSRVESDISKVRAIAFYLPQYHPIPENDQWWGKGFTEWTNVVKANPLFPGHYQPHMPADLGFYDLRLPEVRNAQAELAREHGIHGFCYYHYWFNGKILLDSPLRKVLESGEPDFPFCLCWANENWTRAWDGRDSDVLIRQNYGPEDDLNHIRHLSGIFSDPRYIRIDGKPLFLVYRASNMPDPPRTTSLWREEARKSGLGELFLCRVERFIDDMKDPRPLGFDAAVEFQPDGIQLGRPDPDPRYAGNAVFKYKELVQAALSKKEPAYLRFPCACPGWDNSSRRQKNAVVFRQSYPQFYETWLEELVARAARRRPEERIVFINAFNEWGEGCHLEPDKRFGKACLEATRRALVSCGKEGSAAGAGSDVVPRVSIVLPVFNRLEHTRQCLEALVDNTPSDLYEVILVNNGSTDGTKRFLANLKGDATVITNETDPGFAKACNQGLEKAKGEYVLLLKNDVVVTEGWLEKLLAHLDPSQEAGMVGPMCNAALGPQAVRKVPYGNNMEEMQTFALDIAARNPGETDVTMGLGGFCLLIRKEALDIVGGLDERYADGDIEVDDLCLRSFIAGYRNVLAGDVFVHRCGGTASKGNGADSQAALKGNLRYFSEKWKKLVEVDGKGCRVCLTRELQLKQLLEWGEEKFSRGDFGGAVKVFRRVLEIDRTNSEALNNIGVIQWQLGDTASAMTIFQNSLAINPKDADALGNLARAAAETGRFDRIDPGLLEILKAKQPANPEIDRIIEARQGLSKEENREARV